MNLFLLLKKLLMKIEKKPISFIFIITFIYSLVLHRILGMDAFWDTANYHIYIGWAASQMTPYTYGAIAQYHTYLNPLIDIINYKLFSIHPFIGALFHSIIFSFTLVIVYLITTEIFKSADNKTVIALMAVFFGATGVMTVSLFGSFTNEHITALLIIAALWLSMCYFKNSNPRTILAAAFLSGAALGLKLTTGSFFVGLLVSIALVAKFNIKTILYASIGVILGIVVTDGIFMLLRWQYVASPIFPFANNIIQSPYYPINWKSFSPFEWQNILYYLLLPVHWLYSSDFSEAPTTRDGRLLLAFTGIILLLLSIVYRRKKLDKSEALVILFFTLSWLTWILTFRVYRYLVVLELLSGIIFLMGLNKVFLINTSAKKWGIFILTLIFLHIVTVYPQWGRRVWAHQFVTTNIEEKLKQHNIDFIFFADSRLAYLAPILHANSVEFANLHSQPWYEYEPEKTTIDPDAVDISNKRNIYFLQYSNKDVRANSPTLEKMFHDKVYICSELKTNMMWSPYLCYYGTEADKPEIQVGNSYPHDSESISFDSGWSAAEPTLRWSKDTQSVISTYLPAIPADCQVTVLISGHTNGKQKVEMTANGIPAFSETLEGKFKIEVPIKITLEKTRQHLELVFILPDAKSPSESDNRKLAIALTSLKFDCN